MCKGKSVRRIRGFGNWQMVWHPTMGPRTLADWLHSSIIALTTPVSGRIHSGKRAGASSSVPRWVISRSAGAAPDRIAVLRLDTDWYSSTRHEMEHLYPRLSPGGVLIIDDYGHWSGSQKAVDEYLAANDIALLLARTDYTGRMAIKPAE